MSRFSNLLSTLKDFGKVVATETRDATAEGLLSAGKAIKPSQERLEESEAIRLGWKVKAASKEVLSNLGGAI